MADVLKKVPVREQDPKVRAANFEEVCLGYNQEEAMEEAARCINCKNAKCIQGCPVAINIPGFIKEVKDGNIEEAYKVIGQASALPAICGRVCPQESQCEGQCIRGIKGERSPSVSWSVSLQTMRWNMISNRLAQRRQTGIKSQ